MPLENISGEAKRFCSRHGLMPSEQRCIYEIFVLNLLTCLLGVKFHLSMRNRAGCRGHKERSILDELSEYHALRGRPKRRTVYLPCLVPAVGFYLTVVNANIVLYMLDCSAMPSVGL